MRGQSHVRTARRAVPVTAALVAGVLTLHAQAVRVEMSGTAPVVHASGIRFIRDEVLDRLKDGAAVRVEIDLDVADARGGVTLGTAHHTCTVSYDIWAERFAASRSGPPVRSMPHLQARQAEAWCFEALALPPFPAGRTRSGAPFWMRLHYRIQLPDPAQASDDDSGFSLARLIDTLSRRGASGRRRATIEAGPFQLQE